MSQLVTADPDFRCRATVVIPVFNEEDRITDCLTALLHQTLPKPLYEVIVLLNNCTDDSPRMAHQFQEMHPTFALHLVERVLPKMEANVGTARRLLMEEASRRLPQAGVILSTDGDTAVERDWVEKNLEMLNNGSDAVGGDISLDPSGFAKLSASARRHYREDASYQQAVTLLESILDPDPHDPWPRHHHHFGASLACTNSLYTRLGGLPRADCLEDVAFVKSIMRADARLRHSPEVRVVTAARISGRARIGLASQLREWQEAHEDPRVDSVTFLKEYFEWRRQLRAIWNGETLLRASGLESLATRLGLNSTALEEQLDVALTFGSLLEAIDLRGRLWRGMHPLRRVARRTRVTEEVYLLASSLLSAEHQSGSSLPGFLSNASIRSDRESSHVPDLLWRDSPEQLA